MLRTFMRSKIHRATVTGSDLNYAGSLTLTPELLKAADIAVHELVQVVNIYNGARFETYTIAGTAGTGEVIANGAAARLVQRGDKIIIITYAQLTDSELAGHQPQSSTWTTRTATSTVGVAAVVPSGCSVTLPSGELGFRTGPQVRDGDQNAAEYGIVLEQPAHTRPGENVSDIVCELPGAGASSLRDMHGENEGAHEVAVHGWRSRAEDQLDIAGGTFGCRLPPEGLGTLGHSQYEQRLKDSVESFRPRVRFVGGELGQQPRPRIGERIAHAPVSGLDNRRPVRHLAIGQLSRVHGQEMTADITGGTAEIHGSNSSPTAPSAGAP